MKNAQPTSRDKGIKEGRLDFTTPPLQISHTHNRSTFIHNSLSQNTQPSTHTHTAPTKKQQHGLATQHMFPQSVTEPAN